MTAKKNAPRMRCATELVTDFALPSRARGGNGPIIDVDAAR